MKNSHVITRRDFVRQSTAAAAGLGLLNSRDLLARTDQKSTVYIIRDEKVLSADLKVDGIRLRKMVDEAVMAVTGAYTPAKAWGQIAGPKDIVGLVPTPHLNPTHQELIDVIEASLIEAGIPAGNIRDAQGSPEKAKACTVLIALPALKAHWLTGIGTVMKNYIMYSGAPSRYHQSNSANLGEIWKLPFVKGKTRLILVDALRPLCDKGPQPDPRFLWPYRGLIAGTDPVATDSVCLKIITAKREAIKGEPWPLLPPPICVEAADKVFALGTSDPAKITVIKRGWEIDALI
jgi:hypothetical protein